MIKLEPTRLGDFGPEDCVSSQYSPGRPNLLFHGSEGDNRAHHAEEGSAGPQYHGGPPCPAQYATMRSALEAQEEQPASAESQDPKEDGETCTCRRSACQSDCTARHCHTY